jgi:hypothetical protein
MENMEDKKKLGMILTIVAVLLCGCPGLCMLVFGATFSMGYGLEDYGWEVTGDPIAFTGFGIAGICVGVLGILLTIGAGVYWYLQSRKESEVGEVVVPDPLDGEVD